MAVLSGDRFGSCEKEAVENKYRVLCHVPATRQIAGLHPALHHICICYYLRGLVAMCATELPLAHCSMGCPQLNAMGVWDGGWCALCNM